MIATPSYLEALGLPALCAAAVVVLLVRVFVEYRRAERARAQMRTKPQRAAAGPVGAPAADASNTQATSGGERSTCRSTG